MIRPIDKKKPVNLGENRVSIFLYTFLKKFLRKWWQHKEIEWTLRGRGKRATDEILGKDRMRGDQIACQFR